MNERRSLVGRVAVVTGASRGVGRGIALALGAYGATVYVTGRTLDRTQGHTSGTLNEVTAELNTLGGRGIAVRCDHADDTQVSKLFDRVQAEHGRLDLLINNATAIGPNPLAPPPFWNKNLDIADQFIVGLRTAFVACYYAALDLLQRRTPSSSTSPTTEQSPIILTQRMVPPRLV